jgi:RimJ/RimL family protein N-acetyltransferase
VLAPAYPILTKRLLLRPLTPDDADALHAYQSREDVCRYIPYFPRSREELAARLADAEKTRATLDAEGQALNLAVVLRGAGEVVGDVMLFWHSAAHRSGEIGYVLHPAHHGNGYVLEACGALLALAFDGLGLHRVVGRVDARNEPSVRVLRRLGMRQEAVLVENEWFKGEWSTEIAFAILDREWREQAQASA